MSAKSAVTADAGAGAFDSIQMQQRAGARDTGFADLESKTQIRPITRVREVRLDQNRKAARESRRRKKVMIEELQRSVIFFSRANSTLKQQNDDLTRLLMQAQTQISQLNEDGTTKSEEGKPSGNGDVASPNNYNLPPGGAKGPGGFAPLPPMQPGATMQAMSNFQQAAAAAMQAAMQGMQGIPGINIGQLTTAPSGSNAQQAYTDTMTALAMQQAAVAAAGHQFTIQQGFPAPFNPYNMWPANPQQMQQMAHGGEPSDQLQDANADGNGKEE